MAALKASLDIFEEADFKNILEKSKRLSAYLLFVLNDINKNASTKVVEILTPQNAAEHDSQVSTRFL